MSYHFAPKTYIILLYMARWKYQAFNLIKKEGWTYERLHQERPDLLMTPEEEMQSLRTENMRLKTKLKKLEDEIKELKSSKTLETQAPVDAAPVDFNDLIFSIQKKIESKWDVSKKLDMPSIVTSIHDKILNQLADGNKYVETLEDILEDYEIEYLKERRLI